MSSSNLSTTSATPSTTPALGNTPPHLSYYCVYNPSLGQSEENTKDQILYYTAKKVVPADVKMKQIGLAQALVNFSSAFSPRQPAQNVHSQKNRLVFWQPEPGFWMHMCVELGVVRKQLKDNKGKEKLVTEYLDAQLSDRALEALLRLGYEQFKLLNGTMTSIMDGLPQRQGARTLMHHIEEFFSEWIWQWDLDRLDTMIFAAVYHGVPRFPLPRADYQRLHEIVSASPAQLDVISHTMIFDNDRMELVYRSPSLKMTDVRALRTWLSRHAQGHPSTKPKEKEEKKEFKMSGIKTFTKSFSHTHILNYFTPSKSTSTTATAPADEDTTNTLPSPSDIPTAPSSPNLNTATDMPQHGTYLSGRIQKTVVDLSGATQTRMESEVVRVYLDNVEGGLDEYFLVVYKHESNFVWVFLLPSYMEGTEDLLAGVNFYVDLEKHIVEHQVDKIKQCCTKELKEKR
ncbi:hypothetical protein BCR43DRAFT_434982 [Syncephalastrum racemosum]|uniref:CCZ1/INTU/HSP4 first Longin domain-containing protein n=1 Tax=Syncephalastrum racemosum TaxID=13706 RepID=A0A1X2HQF5_SYNRA|nr:hypothetical protein BCR43DRAFT_434982 [Syncephalastrum racemosum]